MSLLMARIKNCAYGLLITKDLGNALAFYTEVDRVKDEKEEVEKYLSEAFFTDKKREDYVYFPLSFEEFCIFNFSSDFEMQADIPMPFPCFLGHLFSYRDDIVEFCISCESIKVKPVLGLLKSLEAAYKENDDYAVKETLDMLTKISKEK